MVVVACLTHVRPTLHCADPRALSRGDFPGGAGEASDFVTPFDLSCRVIGLRLPLGEAV